MENKLVRNASFGSVRVQGVHCTPTEKYVYSAFLLHGVSPLLRFDGSYFFGLRNNDFEQLVLLCLFLVVKHFEFALIMGKGVI